jgi:hypothetical protein
MFPQFYQNHLEKQLKPTQYHTLKSLVYILQSHKQVSIELLASFWPYSIQFESRRRSLQRFLQLDCFKIESLWFPLVKEILKAKFQSFDGVVTPSGLKICLSPVNEMSEGWATNSQASSETKRLTRSNILGGCAARSLI